MAKEVSSNEFLLDLSYLIGEYEKRLQDEEVLTNEVSKARITALYEACKDMDGKSLNDLLTLIDTGAFNNIISAYCLKALDDLGKSELSEEMLEKLNELYDADAESIVLPYLTIESSDEE